MSYSSVAGGILASSGCYNNCTIFLSIALLLSGLRVASSSPIGDQEWLSNPCNKQPVIRHGRSAAENQLSRFLQDMKVKFFKEIKHMYKFTRNENFTGNCPKINKMIKPICNATSFTAAMHAFYETLLQFAVFIDRLKNTTFITKGEDHTSRRRNIFEETKENLRLLICEYNDTLSRYDSKSTPSKDNLQQQSKPKVPHMNISCVPKSMDHSQARYMDFDFFNKLQKFLRQSRRCLKNKKKKDGNKNSSKNSPKRRKKARNQKLIKTEAIKKHR